MSVKKFNENQDSEYLEYCNKCKANGVEPAKQSRYFPKIKVNYGYAYQNRFGEIYWKKRKQDFNV